MSEVVGPQQRAGPVAMTGQMNGEIWRKFEKPLRDLAYPSGDRYFMNKGTARWNRTYRTPLITEEKQRGEVHLSQPGFMTTGTIIFLPLSPGGERGRAMHVERQREGNEGRESRVELQNLLDDVCF